MAQVHLHEAYMGRMRGVSGLCEAFMPECGMLSGDLKSPGRMINRTNKGTMILRTYHPESPSHL